jgi:hypothetical protein
MSRDQHAPMVAPAPPMTIRLGRRRDGAAILRCERADGTVTWQRQEGKIASVFPFHDMTHYVVETELGFRAGFFGLVAQGWDINDTSGKTARGPLPEEAITVENVVGLFDVQRSLGVEWTADEVNEQARIFATARGTPAPPVLADDEVSKIRQRIRDLFERWNRLTPDETLDLPFDTGTL